MSWPFGTSQLDSKEREFLAAIQANPSDARRRMDFLEWLNATGNPGAEFVRLDSAFRRGGAGVVGKSPGYSSQYLRWRHLKSNLRPHWKTAFGHLFTLEELAAVAPPNAEGGTRCSISEYDIEMNTESPMYSFYRSLLIIRENIDAFSSSVEFFIEACRAARKSDCSDYLRMAHYELECWRKPERHFNYYEWCRPVAELAWDRIVNDWRLEFETVPPLLWKGDFVAAVEISEIGVGAMYTDEYVALFHTPA